MVRRALIVCFTVMILLAASTALVGSTDGLRAVIEPTEREGIEVWLDKDCYEPGSYLTIHFKAERSGYLTIYSMSPDGDASVLFPNAYYSDNHIQGGVSYSLPSSSDPFKIRVEAPSVSLPDAKEIIWGIITAERITLPTPDGRGQIDLARAVRSQVLSSTVWWASDKCEFGYGPCEEEPPPEHTENLALIIGINDYIDRWAPSPDDPGVKIKFPKLHSPVKSGQAFARLIQDEYEVRTILNDEATYANIKDNFTDWLSEAQPDSKVVIYYAGHGAIQEDKNGDETDGKDEAWVPYNWADERQFILDDEIAIWIEGIDAKEVVLISDCCHSGTIADIKEAFPQQREILTYAVSYSDRGYLPRLRGTSMLDEELSRRYSRKGASTIISLEACKATEVSYGVKFPDVGWFNLFSYYIVENITNAGSEVSTRDTFGYASRMVVKLTTQQHEKYPEKWNIQHPSMESNTTNDIYLW